MLKSAKAINRSPLEIVGFCLCVFDILDLLSGPPEFVSFLGWAACWREEGEEMPRKPLKPCRYPGCPKLTSGLYCEDHQGIMDRNYNQYTRSANHNKKYGRAWKRIRDRYIKEHPLCELCLKEQKLIPATEVHHIVFVENGGGNEDSNLLAVCHSHHQWIHKNFKSGEIKKG